MGIIERLEALGFESYPGQRYEDAFGPALDELEEARRDIQRLKELLTASERFRLAYQDGKGKLYAKGGAIAEAAMECLPCNEGPLESAVSRHIGNLHWQESAATLIEWLSAITGTKSFDEIRASLEEAMEITATKRQEPKPFPFPMPSGDLYCGYAACGDPMYCVAGHLSREDALRVVEEFERIQDCFETHEHYKVIGGQYLNQRWLEDEAGWRWIISSVPEGTPVTVVII